MKKLLFLPFALTVLAACNTSNTKDNDPWGAIDLTTAPKQSAIIESSISSSVLHQKMTYSVWLPAGYDESETYPFLYLLHGYEYGDQSRLDRCWLDKGNAARIADDYQKAKGVPMVIVMPNGMSYFYQGDYETYMHEELMPQVEKDFHCNGQRAISGLSMGGYGTLYHAIKYPSKFTYAYAMSPAANVSMAQMVTDATALPGITIETGEQDQTTKLIEIKPFVNAMENKGVKIDFIVRDGTHDWSFWQGCLPKALITVGRSFQ